MAQITRSVDSPRFAHKLRARLAQLRAEIRGALLKADTETYGELAGQVHDAEDESLADLMTDVTFAEIAREVQEVRDIDAALRRIANGTYGSCVDCGDSIDPARLDAWPTAKRCLTCQRTHERTHAVSRPAKL